MFQAAGGVSMEPEITRWFFLRNNNHSKQTLTSLKTDFTDIMEKDNVEIFKNNGSTRTSPNRRVGFGFSNLKSQKSTISTYQKKCHWCWSRGQERYLWDTGNGHRAQVGCRAEACGGKKVW